ncbi:MAG: ammonia-forming cytochrome c nitrite reductase subunit c552 [Betaproteobacteria bacterium]
MRTRASGPALCHSVLLGGLMAAALFCGSAFAQTGRPGGASPPGPASSPAWVGVEVCAGCHAAQHQAWSKSQHSVAMQVASAQTVLGNFDQARFSYAGVTSSFFRRDGKFWVNTDGPSGKLGDFEILYTFGVAPLQQYLIALPGGRLQAFGIAWDSRAQSQGGQRWLHLYPGQNIKAGDPLHWSGLEQNWNYQCADCHSTHLQKHYNAETRSFASTWSEINVSCEACHGPGASHVAWAKAPSSYQGKDRLGLVSALDERRGVLWTIDPKSGSAVRSAARSSEGEIEACARCHSRRGQFDQAFVHGRSLAHAYRAATLDPGLYWSDGQMRDEVYNYGSFLQSRMHAKGVSCADCHEPHSQQLRLPGNALCAPCHLPARFDGPQHHHHVARGAGCVDCHMPVVGYMQVDQRHDHSFRIPRPDLTSQIGVPNTCNQCHKDKSAQWASVQLKQWFGHEPMGYQRFAKALSDAGKGALPPETVVGELAAIAGDAAHSAIARATVLARLAHYPSAASFDAARKSLRDAHFMVREAAVNALASAPAEQRALQLPALLRDPAPTVRMAAVRALAGVPEGLLKRADASAFKAGLSETLRALAFNADRPEARSNLGMLYAQRGETDKAQIEYRAAITLDPSFFHASINLADLLQRQGREPEGERVLRQALANSPRAALLHHALGLSLVRQGRLSEALPELRAAVEFDPVNARLSYVYAVALHDSGRGPEALRVLQQALKHAPGNRMLSQALASFSGEAAN